MSTREFEISRFHCTKSKAHLSCVQDKAHLEQFRVKILLKYPSIHSWGMNLGHLHDKSLFYHQAMPTTNECDSIVHIIIKSCLSLVYVISPNGEKIITNIEGIKSMI